MPIIYHKNSAEFHLYNSSLSYIINIMPNKQLGQLYYGKRLRDRESFAGMAETSCRPMASWNLREYPNFSLEFTRQEYPSFGTSDFRQPAFEIISENGSHISNFEYVCHNIYNGKPEMQGLPHSYVENPSEAVTLEIELQDSLLNATLILYYTIFENISAIARSAKFINNGTETLKLNRAMSVSVDFPDHDFEWIQFSGAWGRERKPISKKLELGLTAVESMRGQSSANQNPFVILKRNDATEFMGEAYGFNFVYSGNFLAQTEVDTYNTTRFTMGINPRNFSWKLLPNQEFQTPEVLMSYSSNGLNGLSQEIHTLLQKRVARGYWRDKARPILLNNWEATGMNFTEDDILKIARKGAEVGIELFVLDDGWFGHRTEFSGLGDWFVDKTKLPNGIKGLADKINALGLKFGIWIEPEMINEQSELYKQHPEFVLCTPDRRKSLGRNQLVLDFANPNVVDYIYNMLVETFGDANISYIKWDMNRSITECYSSFYPADQQGEVYHRYIMGVYALYEKLIAKYPKMLFESCSSGGSRFDAGMLYYAPQAWCSDDTDAIERVKIQYGSSYGYPVSSWGSHVSECPNQQLGRMTSVKTRGNVAFFGAFGYEMDLNALSDDEIELVKRQIEFMKANRELIQFGKFYRLVDPYKNNIGSWMVVSEDKTEAIVGLYQLMNSVNAGFTQLKLSGLNEEFDYCINDNKIYGGDELMSFGFIPQDGAAHPLQALFAADKAIELYGDYDSCLYRLKKV